MDQRVVVISEAPPRMETLDAEAARKFLKEYQGYEMRVDSRQAQIPMMRCLGPEDFETLVECTIDDLQTRGIRVVNREEAQRVPVQPQRGPEMANPNDEVRSEGEERKAAEAGDAAQAAELWDSDEDENVVPERVVVRNSNAHVEEMLIAWFGPEEPAEAIALLKRIKMSKDSPFSTLSLATDYKRDWRMALRWCRNHELRGKHGSEPQSGTGV